MVAEKETGYGTVTQVKWNAQSMGYSGDWRIERRDATELRGQLSICHTRQTRRKYDEGYCKREIATIGQRQRKDRGNYQSLSARIVR